jgi:hypothetical protein
MTNPKARLNGIGKRAVFYNEYDAGIDVGGFFAECEELLVGRVTNRTLRAMLENENWMSFGFFDKLIQVFASL